MEALVLAIVVVGSEDLGNILVIKYLSKWFIYR